ncbi:hypothetical protein [Rheinheimera sp.]|uniref:hypothetical protein n=1 Tax=Rheinheimera sp. TaxID=1869214 RepID=UPI0027374577|nr:hypothetical protein [Rheinheimera sp.]MDP2713395.1 hypothetical protein [Rheinheimera sp.]
MNRDYLIKSGKELVKELLLRAAGFNGKSSQHDELSWEAVGVETRVTKLEQNDHDPIIVEAGENDDWGKGLFAHSPEQSKKVAEFYRKLYQELGTKQDH